MFCRCLCRHTRPYRYHSIRTYPSTTRYRHYYKGTIYYVLNDSVIDASNDNSSGARVVYHRQGDRDNWYHRPRSEFFGDVVDEHGNTVKRFTKVVD